MKKWLIVALALVVSPIPGPAKSLPQLSSLKSVAGLPALSDASVPPAAGAPVAAAPAPASVDPAAQPDWNYTPGRLCVESDSDYQERRYPERIVYCRRHVTKAMKQEVAAHYGIPESEWHDYEFDHLIPLAIGGNSRIENLWPEPNAQNDGPNSKDKLEYALYLELSAGKITQAEAVRQIYAWFGRHAPFKSFAPTGR